MNEQLKQFFTLLDESGLPEDRKMFWAARIRDGQFTEEDDAVFVDELQSHLNDINTALAATEIEMDQAKKRRAGREEQALPYLQQLSGKQGKFQEDEAAAYKKAVLGAEKDMMAKIEDIRSVKTAEKIEEIRKKLQL